MKLTITFNKYISGPKKVKILFISFNLSPGTQIKFSKFVYMIELSNWI
jgi:hypothetical protein